ncbi:MAG: acetyl-CoA carboxylase biotin carboxyl carrier protein [Acidobacteria bacterium]|nr:acetyl-CoA carboxylase biotin carboxyl carrier protein [Acidobacteriota bacterium]
MVQEKKQISKNSLDFDEIKKLIEMLEKSSLEELEVDYKDIHLRLKKPSSSQTIINQSPPAVIAPPFQGVAHHPMNIERETIVQAESESEKAVSSSATLFEVKSPMVGTFYRAPAPNADPFVKVGDLVKKGQTLCIIEAMKIMNEIECEVDGKLIEIKVQNADPVEYGEVIMVIDQAL